MSTESSNHRSSLVAAIILLAALSIYLLLDLTISVSLNLIISGGFALLILVLMLSILEPFPFKQKLLFAGLIATAVISLRFVDWDGRKSFLRDFNQIQPGMTAEEIDSVLTDYNKTIGPFVNQSVQGDLQTGTITYQPTAEALADPHTLKITFAGGRVIASSYYAD